jgi:hypothetical protein
MFKHITVDFEKEYQEFFEALNNEWKEYIKRNRLENLFVFNKETTAFLDKIEICYVLDGVIFFRYEGEIFVTYMYDNPTWKVKNIITEDELKEIIQKGELQNHLINRYVTDYFKLSKKDRDNRTLSEFVYSFDLDERVQEYHDAYDQKHKKTVMEYYKNKPSKIIEEDGELKIELFDGTKLEIF